MLHLLTVYSDRRIVIVQRRITHNQVVHTARPQVVQIGRPQVVQFIRPSVVQYNPASDMRQRLSSLSLPSALVYERDELSYLQR